MTIHIVNKAGVRAVLTSTFATTGNPSDDMRIVSLHGEDGQLMEGYSHPLIGPLVPEDVEHRAQEWAIANGWSRVPDED